MDGSTTQRLSSAMDISALVNHDSEAAVLPRRSLSHSHSISASSPVVAAAKIPTPTRSMHRQMPLKRERHDPRPIWAYREDEDLPPELQQLQEQRQLAAQQRPPAPQPRPPPVQSHAQPRPPQPSPMAPRNGALPASDFTTELVGFERPVSDDAAVYNDVSRQVCDFIWVTAVNNELIRNAISDPQTELEVEARWGHIIDKRTDSRFRGYHKSECVINTETMDVKFESTMTMDQHKRMNMYLNSQVQKSNAPDTTREKVKYQHTREIDIFYELDQEGFVTLHPLVQQVIRHHGGRQRIRVTRDGKTGEILRAIIKQRVANMEISSPSTEWDYRIGINLEINYSGPLDKLQPTVEAGRTPESMKRHKDRMSYSWMDAYQVDLTQVGQGQTKNHELELELDAGTLIDNADKVRRKEANCFEGLINGMMNNMRVLSREITPPAPA